MIDDLMYKHWDEWVEEIPHPYIASFDGKQLTDITDIMEGEPYESPMKPFGGIESFAWTPDSKSRRLYQPKENRYGIFFIDKFRYLSV